MSQRGKSRLRAEAITCLLSESTIEDAATKAGISKRTLIRWLQEQEFRADYNRAKGDVLRTATAILTRNAGKAAQTLEEIFSGKPEPHQGARVASASATLRLALDSFALENLEERIRNLEKQRNEPL